MNSRRGIQTILFLLALEVTRSLAAISEGGRLNFPPLQGRKKLTDDELIWELVEEIRANDLLNAGSRYLNYDKKDLMSKAIRTCFSANVDLKTLLLFTEEFPSLTLRTDAMTSLIAEMTETKSPDPPDPEAILLMEEYISEKYEKIVPRLPEEAREAFAKINDEFARAEENIVNDWARELLRYRAGYSSGFWNIRRFGYEHRSATRYFEQLIDSAFQQRSEDDIFNSFLYLAHEMAHAEHAAAIIKRLYFNMNNNTLLTMNFAKELAREIVIREGGQIDYQNARENRLPSFVQESLNEVMNGLPASVSGVARGEKLCITNLASSKVLTFKDFDEERDIVFVDEKSYREWIFQTDKKNRAGIKSAGAAGNFLIAEETERTEDKKRMFTWKLQSSSYKELWEIRDYNWIDNQYFLFNIPQNGFLDVDASGEVILTPAQPDKSDFDYGRATQEEESQTEAEETTDRTDIAAVDSRVWVIDFCGTK